MCGYEHCIEVLVEKWRRARNEHWCFACRERIRPGDRYHYTVQIEDGIGTYKHCARCWTMIEALLDAGAEAIRWDLHCGTPYEEVFGVPPPEHVARLAFITPDEAQELVR